MIVLLVRWHDAEIDACTVSGVSLRCLLRAAGANVRLAEFMDSKLRGDTVSDNATQYISSI